MIRLHPFEPPTMSIFDEARLACLLAALPKLKVVVSYFDELPHGLSRIALSAIGAAKSPCWLLAPLASAWASSAAAFSSTSCLLEIRLS